MINGGDILLIYTKMLLLLLLINICYSNYTLLCDCYVDFSPSFINSYNLILFERNQFNVDNLLNCINRYKFTSYSTIAVKKIQDT